MNAKNIYLAGALAVLAFLLAGRLAKSTPLAPAETVLADPGAEQRTDPWMPPREHCRDRHKGV
jgi:hypothetical protein